MFIRKCLEEKNIKSIDKAGVPGSTVSTPSLDLRIKTEDIKIKSERNEQEEEFIETKFTIVKSEGEHMIKTECIEIKSEDNDKESNKSVDIPSPECISETCDKAASIRHQLVLRDPMNTCHSCDFKTKYKRNLWTHQLQHKDPLQIRMYMCDLCDYKTKYKSYLRTHQLKHADSSEVQMHKCHLCDYKTKYKSCLKSHQKKHADPSAVRMYKCDLCDFTTKCSNFGIKRFTSHQMTHAYQQLHSNANV